MTPFSLNSFVYWNIHSFGTSIEENMYCGWVFLSLSWKQTFQDSYRGLITFLIAYQHTLVQIWKYNNYELLDNQIAYQHLRPEEGGGKHEIFSFVILYERAPENEQVEKKTPVNPTLHSRDIFISMVLLRIPTAVQPMTGIEGFKYQAFMYNFLYIRLSEHGDCIGLHP